MSVSLGFGCCACLMRKHPCPLAKPGVAQSKGVWQGGGTPGLDKRSAEGWGNPARRRRFTLARREGQRPLEETVFLLWSREQQRLFESGSGACERLTWRRFGKSPSDRSTRQYLRSTFEF